MLIFTSMNYFSTLSWPQDKFFLCFVWYLATFHTHIVRLVTSLGNTDRVDPLTQFRIFFWIWGSLFNMGKVYYIFISLTFFSSEIWVNFLHTGEGMKMNKKAIIKHHIFPALQERTVLVERSLMNRSQSGPLALPRPSPGNKEHAFHKADKFTAKLF